MFVHVCARCGRSELLTWAFLQFTPVPLVWRPAFCEVFFLGGGGGGADSWLLGRWKGNWLALPALFANPRWQDSGGTWRESWESMGIGVRFHISYHQWGDFYNYQNDPSDPSVILSMHRLCHLLPLVIPFGRIHGIPPRVMRSPLGLSRS